MVKDVEIPEGIDGFFHVLMFEADEVGVIFGLLYIGLFTKQLVICIFLILIFVRIYIYYKKRKLRGFFIHYPYRWGLIPLNKYFPNGAITEYLE
ncbi:hypothetical protein BKE30_14640 [Alkanindiges hydrocarboniclasticus]|uniref:Type IV conjugative transfer system protein TraL n=1 Tax=Alkanindiges hydrocarboniclasticus TaxID=1907941 RepID=A0A1S8CRQ9_9GAMM|nr:hypothetical protein BKE30_14640 [Alkanindiges hydrocarboniclasticus]